MGLRGSGRGWGWDKSWESNGCMGRKGSRDSGWAFQGVMSVEDEGVVSCRSGRTILLK
jgi:hypothetical protein